MEGCGIPPKRAGQHRRKMSTEYLSQNTTFWIPFVAKEKNKKTTEQILLPPITEKESQSSNVKAADRYVEKKIQIEVMSLDMHHLH